MVYIDILKGNQPTNESFLGNVLSLSKKLLVIFSSLILIFGVFLFMRGMLAVSFLQIGIPAWFFNIAYILLVWAVPLLIGLIMICSLLLHRQVKEIENIPHVSEEILPVQVSTLSANYIAEKISKLSVQFLVFFLIIMVVPILSGYIGVAFNNTFLVKMSNTYQNYSYGLLLLIVVSFIMVIGSRLYLRQYAQMYKTFFGHLLIADISLTTILILFGGTFIGSNSILITVALNLISFLVMLIVGIRDMVLGKGKENVGKAFWFLFILLGILMLYMFAISLAAQGGRV